MVHFNTVLPLPAKVFHCRVVPGSINITAFIVNFLKVQISQNTKQQHMATTVFSDIPRNSMFANLVGFVQQCIRDHNVFLRWDGFLKSQSDVRAGPLKVTQSDA